MQFSPVEEGCNIATRRLGKHQRSASFASLFEGDGDSVCLFSFPGILMMTILQIVGGS